MSGWLDRLKAPLYAGLFIETRHMEILELVNYFGLESNNYGSLAATLSAALIIFIFKEYIRKPKEFSGVFFIKTTTTKTEYTPYDGLKIFYTINIVSDGSTISGHSEKTGEISSREDIDYIGNKRRPGIVNGRVERNYLRKSILYIVIKEQGQHRDYCTSLRIPISNKMHGTFYSTASDSSGKAECQDIKFSEHPSKSSPRQFTY